MTGRPADPGLDADLATLRRSHVAMYADRKAAADRVEAELARLRENVRTAMGAAERFREQGMNDAAEAARLREERDAAYRNSGNVAIARLLRRVLAAEARCARLQQALAERHRWIVDALSRNQIVHEIDRNRARAFVADWEALAGPDTPGDSQEDKT